MQDGYLIVPQMLPHAALQPLISELTHKVDNAIREAVRQGQLDAAETFAGAPFAQRLALASDACKDRRWLWQTFFSRGKPISAGMFALRTTPQLLDATEDLIGPEILAHPQFALRPKMPDLDLLDIPWHQDLAYLIPEEAGETLVVNFWIPLVPATAQNGCMQVIPGSHLLGLLEHDILIKTKDHRGTKRHPQPGIAARRFRHLRGGGRRCADDDGADGAPLHSQPLQHRPLERRYPL